MSVRVLRSYVGMAVLAGCVALAHAQAPRASLAERDQAQAERAALQSEIQRIEQDMRKAERERAAAADALRESEQAISVATRRLAELEAEGKRLAEEESRLEARRKELGKLLQQRQTELAQLLRQHYQHGSESPWRALLSGDDPHDAGRRMGYLGYLSRARAQLVKQIRQEEAELGEVQAQLAARRQEWAAVRQEQVAQREERVRQQQERRKVLERISAELTAQRGQAERLKNDAQQLSALIAEINRTLARQAAERERREAERRAKERAEAEARAAAEAKAAAEARAQVRAAAAAREAAASAERARAAQPPSDPLGLRADEMVADPPGKQEIPADQPAQGPAVASISVRPAGTPAGGEAAPARGTARAAADTPKPVAPAARRFADLRGRLPLPVRGTVSGRFGETRPDGGTWRGIFIPAAEGAQVRAVAAGTVVFSGWLRGFGNLLILDHGDDYLTVYGNNEAILKQVGDAVAAGDAVATVGATGGLPQSGIYFEIRHRGGPIDPLPWSNLP